MGDAEEQRFSARRRARLSEAPPDVSPEFSHLNLEQLRALRRDITQYETQVSYWRRLVQARIDLLGEGEEIPNIDKIIAIMSRTNQVRQRHALLDLLPVDTSPPLPELDAIWNSTDCEDIDCQLRNLQAAERELSALRRRLFEQIDSLHAELIARYRLHPESALDLLPHPYATQGKKG